MTRYRLVLTFGQHEFTSDEVRAQNAMAALKELGFYDIAELAIAASRLEVKASDGWVLS